MPPAVEFLNVTRYFDEVRAVDHLSFTIDQGEFFSLLGPSGSGKTTCLRLIAGFDQPTSGSIRLSGQEAAQLPPYDRDVNTVFQDYALFPHMSVGQNVGYSLMLKKVPKQERDRRVGEMLDLVQLSNLGDRRPNQLSGGQRQRVALARALINQPKVLLLDEPLGALDLKLRQQMQTELKAIQQRLGITFIFVTHDQEEALTMSDRMAVFNQGKIEQVGSPIEVYEQPKTPFVADFVGISNLIQGSLAERLTGSPQPIALRPEKIQLHSIDQGESQEGAIGNIQEDSIQEGNIQEGNIQEAVYLGMYTRYRVQLDPAGELTVVEQNSTGSRFQTGDRVRLTWQSQHVSPVTP